MINNRLTKLFAEKKSEILSLFYTAGYPELNDTVNIAQACQSAGVDLLEIGIPFSDSLVDGPTIQASNEVALSNGMSLNVLFEQLKELRASVNLPIILMGCINPIEQYGMQKFCQKLNELGIDGALIADLPPEVFESDYKSIFEKYNLSFIPLITTRTDLTRAKYLDNLSQGFLYLVSSAAVTGGNLNTQMDAEGLNRINNYKLNNPLLLGFGIRDTETYKAALKYASGAIIGSAFIRALSKTNEALESRIISFVRTIR